MTIGLNDEYKLLNLILKVWEYQLQQMTISFRVILQDE